MEHKFDMTYGVRRDAQGHLLRSGITSFLAETNLGPSPQLDFPQTITGKLAAMPQNASQLTPDQLFQFGMKPDVEVLFEGKRYSFSKLEKDGTFELSMVQP
jgi:hypothetical protein